MKRFLFVAISLFVWLGALAQESKQLININQASFRPEQKDVLEKVNIDPIAKDRSQRACARIKLHVNRMTREEIDQLQVVIAGGNVALTKKVTSFEGNGLIIEMTAKPQTRFHIHHDKYGDSNQVTVDLEGNKVYLLDAQLDLLLPIAVASNVKGADVYIDEQYKGVIGENYMLTIEDVTPGEHKITIKHGAATAEQRVNVNSGNISFRVEVNDESSQLQYVVFELQPSYAILFIDNEPQATQEGFAQALLQNGTYNYRVIAKGYHEQSGSFTVEGKRVVRKVELKADAAMVTLTTDPSAEIWINNQKKGTGSWSGQLSSGNYIFEARKEGCRTTKFSQVITSAQATQSYKLEAPTPIEGSLNITSVPALASVKVDGKSIGEAPLVTKLMVGKHTVEVSKSGYDTWRKEVVISEGQTASVSATLTKNETKSSVSTTPASSASSVASSKSYKVGDYYNENGKKGVVFWVDETGKHGKIVSLTESTSELQWSSDEYEQKRLIGADSKSDGAKNMAFVKQIRGWESKYPAFKWCADLGEGWYLPAIEELKNTLDKTIHDAVNQTLETKGVKLANIGDSYAYWSSTECDQKSPYGEFCAWNVGMRYGYADYYGKYNLYYVRAVAEVNFEVCSATANVAPSINPDLEEAIRLYDAKDYTNAFPKLLKVAETGDAEAEYYVGLCYFYGRGVTRTPKQAIEWYLKAAEQNYAPAQDILGFCYKLGLFGVSKDYKESFKWFHRAANQGYASAQVQLGRCYADGKGVAQDWNEAVKWFRKAAEQDYAMGQVDLGKCYAEGKGVAQDWNEAIKWYRKAAERGNVAGQTALGLCYEEGNGVAQDYSEAVRWYTTAAKKSRSYKAQYLLGRCYENGNGVKRNRKVAIEWYRKASKYEPAKDRLIELGVSVD